MIVLVACSGTPSIDRALPEPEPDVTLTVEWRLPLVDKGIFPYQPSELGRIEVSRDGRTLFVGTSDGRMLSVDGFSGQILWEYPVGEPVDGWPALSGTDLYFGASDGHLYALNAMDGTLRWRFEAGGNLDSRPAVTERQVLFANASGSVVCLDRTRGVPLWTVNDETTAMQIMRDLTPPVKGQASPLVVEDRLYVGFPSGRIASLSLDRGQQQWSTDLAAQELRHVDVDEVPVLVGDRLIAISFAGGMAAIDPPSGRVLWQTPLRGATRPVPFEGQLLTTTVDSRLVSLDLETGQPRFTLSLSDHSPGPVYLVDGYALFVTSQGGLYLVSPTTPHLYARFRPTGGFASMAAAPGGRVYALDNEGVLYALRLRGR